MAASDAVQPCGTRKVSSTTGQAITPNRRDQRKTTMKKILIALAAVTAIGAGASAAQAKVNIDINLGGFGVYGGHGYYNHYEPVGYYKPVCHFKKFKVVKWVYGEKHVFWKTKKVCNKVYYGY
jgi:hypothetical protein